MEYGTAPSWAVATGRDEHDQAAHCLAFDAVPGVQSANSSPDSPHFRAALSGVQGAGKRAVNWVTMNLLHLLDDAECFEGIRAHRWPEGVRCPHCHADQITEQGQDEHQRARQRYRCLACQQKFGDLTRTVVAGHHQPLQVWVAGLYLMGLNLSNRQIAHELGEIARLSWLLHSFGAISLAGAEMLHHGLPRELRRGIAASLSLAGNDLQMGSRAV